MSEKENATPRIDDLSFEAALSELEDIVSRLEQGEVDLEDSSCCMSAGRR